MKTTSITERVDRLERCFLAWTALVSGEAKDKGTPEELAAMQQQLGVDMTAMAEEWRSR